MSATIYYTQETVGEEIECDCGYKSEYIDYNYVYDTTDVSEKWTCPQCGKTMTLEEEFI